MSGWAAATNSSRPTSLMSHVPVTSPEASSRSTVGRATRWARAVVGDHASSGMCGTVAEAWTMAGASSVRVVNRTEPSGPVVALVALSAAVEPSKLILTPDNPCPASSTNRTITGAVPSPSGAPTSMVSWSGPRSQAWAIPSALMARAAASTEPSAPPKPARRPIESRSTSSRPDG